MYDTTLTAVDKKTLHLRILYIQKINDSVISLTVSLCLSPTHVDAAQQQERGLGAVWEDEPEDEDTGQHVTPQRTRRGNSEGDAR